MTALHSYYAGMQASDSFLSIFYGLIFADSSRNMRGENNTTSFPGKEDPGNEVVRNNGDKQWSDPS